jgi:GNAT superfamily N-acetyltransferase
VDIEIERVRGDDAVALELVAAMESEGASVYGPFVAGRTSMVAPEEMCPPRGAYVVLRSARRPVAGGGLRDLGGGVAEVKRMFVSPDARRRGLGRRLLAALEETARDLGFERTRLDSGDGMAAVYRAAGYRDIPDYNGNSYARFWGEKVLR